jgi:hypothetical protein
MADDRTAPFPVGGFFLVQLAMIVPVVNIILLLIFAFSGSTNINLQNYSRAVLIWVLVGLVIGLIVGVVGALAAGGIGAYLDSVTNQ